MKKTIFTLSLSIFVFALIISSCKKSDPTPSGSSSTTGNTATNTGNPSGTYNGFLYAAYAVSGTTSINSCVAAFVNTPVAFNPSTPFVATATINAVYVNGTQLLYNTNNDYSYTTLSSLGFPPASWIVNGAGTIPSFTYSNTNSMPIFSGLSSFPNTISKAQNLVIPITGASGYDQIEITVQDSLNNSTTVYVASGTTSVTFLKSSLINLTNCNVASIQINLLKYNPQSINGKKILFALIYATSKDNIVLHN
jgi:hypothetical protein